MSCERPSKSSANDLFPSSVSKLYSSSTSIQGSSRRCRASSSLRRVSSFSLSSSSSRAACHSARVGILCALIPFLLRAGSWKGDYIVSTMANDPFKALAHPIRRDIVERLSGGPATVGEATRDLDVSKPTISRHLKMLEEAGVVTRVIDGRTHRLELQPKTLADTAEWIDSQRRRWERLFDVVGEYLEERKERG